MKIGAAELVRNWGTTMSLVRDGSTVVSSFKGRAVHTNLGLENESFDGSVDQLNFLVIAAADDLAGVVPRKFDVVVIGGENYTVQSARAAGADEVELYKMHVRGGSA